MSVFNNEYSWILAILFVPLILVFVVFAVAMAADAEGGC